MSNEKKKIGFKAEDITRFLDFISHVDENGIFYYRYGAWKNPVEGDRRDTGFGLGRNIDEVYIDGQWVKKVEVGSVGTDMITLRDGLNDIKVKCKGRTFNIARMLKTIEGIQIGSSFTPIALTSNSQEGVRNYYPDKEVKKFEAVKEFSENVALPTAYTMSWDLPDAIVKSFDLKTSKDTRVRLRLYLTTETDLAKALKAVNDNDLVYESIPDTEYKNPECPNYGGNLIPKGDSTVPLANEMYLTSGVRYLIVYDALEPGSLLGKSNIPFFNINYSEEKSEVMMSKEMVETRLEQDITLDRNMWIQSRMKDVDKKKGEPINLIGTYDDERTVVGNTYDQTVLESKGKAKVNNDGILGTIATEEWVSQSSIRKVMCIEELGREETAVLYRLNPPGYVSALNFNNDNTFPVYETNGYLRRFSCVFFPKVRDENCDTFLLTHERGESLNMRFVREDNKAYCIIESTAKKADGSPVSMSIRTDLTGEAPEGVVYASEPYVPSNDLKQESYKQWHISWEVEQSTCRLNLIDPNGGEWSVTRQDTAYLMDASNYFAGSYQKKYDTCVLRLLNLNMLITENPDGTGEVKEIDEITRGIDSAEIVTNIKKNKMHITDFSAVHVYPKESENFHTFFKKSGVYYCDNMFENVPPDTLKENDFKAEVAVKNDDFVVIRAINLRTGIAYTLNKSNGVWGEWVTAGSTWNPKVVDFGKGDNITILINKQMSFVTPEIIFKNRNPEDKESKLPATLPEGYNGSYDIIIKQTAKPISSELKSIVLNTPTRKGIPLSIGTTTVDIDENDIEFVIVSNGCQWTDFGMGWKDGVYPELTIQMINRSSERSVPLLVGEGTINPELLPK